jgi:hypothetical protein
MTKIDGLTAGAVAFAAFAAWYVLRTPAQARATGSVDSIYGVWKDQRRGVGNNLGANLDSMNGAFGMLPSEVNGIKAPGGLGFQGPSTGFWSNHG